MPDQCVSPSNRRSKQLRQVDQCSATFTCPRCAAVIRTCQFCTNCDSAVLDVQATVLSRNTTSKSGDKGLGSAVSDHLATKPVEWGGTVQNAFCIFDTISNPAIVEGSQTWVNEPTTAVIGCTEQTVSAPDEAARDIELVSQPAALNHFPNRSSPSTSCAGRERAERSCGQKESSSVKFKEEKVPELARAGVALRSCRHETRTRRARSKLQEHCYHGVRTRRGVKGFLVEIRPQKWKKTIWLGTYDTAIEAAAAYDAGVFYTDKPKKKYNLRNFTFRFPPLPSYLDIRSSSPDVMKEVKNFVKRQAVFASKLVKDHELNRSLPGQGGLLDVQAIVSRPPVQQAGLAKASSDQAVSINARVSDVPECSSSGAASADPPSNHESEFEELAKNFYGTTLQCLGLPTPHHQQEVIWSPEFSLQLPPGFDDMTPVFNNSCSRQQQNDQDPFDTTEFKYQTSTTITPTSNLGMQQQEEQEQLLAAGTCMSTMATMIRNNKSAIHRMPTTARTTFHSLQQDQDMDISITLQNLEQQLTELQELEFDNSHQLLHTMLIG